MRKFSLKEKFERLKSKVYAYEHEIEAPHDDGRFNLIFDLEEAKMKLKNFELNLSVRR